MARSPPGAPFIQARLKAMSVYSHVVRHVQANHPYQLLLLPPEED